MVQLREKDLSAAQLWPLAQQLRDLTRRYNAQLLINDRIDLALACSADGVHLGAHSIPVAVARTLLGPDRIVGVSTHAAAEIRLASEAGADFVTYGPVYDTPSKRAYGPPQGIEKLRSACQNAPCPVFALGGIKPAHLTDITQSGASGIALISAILSAEDPAKAATQFCTRINRSN